MKKHAIQRFTANSIFCLGASVMTTGAFAASAIDAVPMRAATPVFTAADHAASQRNAETVSTFLRLLEEMNIPAWIALWAEEGRQDMPYAPPGFPQSLVGKARLYEHFSGLPKAMEYMRFPDLKLHLTNDPNVVIAEFRGDIKVAQSDRKYDNTYINVFTFRADGKLVHVKEFFNPLILIEGGAFADGKPKDAGADAVRQ